MSTDYLKLNLQLEKHKVARVNWKWNHDDMQSAAGREEEGDTMGEAEIPASSVEQHILSRFV